MYKYGDDRVIKYKGCIENPESITNYCQADVSPWRVKGCESREIMAY